MARTMQSPRIPIGKQTLPISKGGTESTNLLDAAKKLKLISVETVNQPNGPPELDYMGKMPLDKFKTSNRVSINGPLTVNRNQIAQYEITDFDSFKTYNIVLSAGSYTLNNEFISFVAPSTAQVVTMTVNGKPYLITVS